MKRIAREKVGSFEAGRMAHYRLNGFQELRNDDFGKSYSGYVETPIGYAQLFTTNMPKGKWHSTVEIIFLGRKLIAKRNVRITRTNATAVVRVLVNSILKIKSIPKNYTDVGIAE